MSQLADVMAALDKISQNRNQAYEILCRLVEELKDDPEALDILEALQGQILLLLNHRYQDEP